VLRTIVGGDAFCIIGECYVYGLDDCVTLIGSLLSNMRAQMGKTPSGYSAVQTYLDLDTGLTCSEDPRLQPLETFNEWERHPHEWDADDPALFEYYKNVWTGEVLNSDTRLLPSALSNKGVPLRTFDLR